MRLRFFFAQSRTMPVFDSTKRADFTLDTDANCVGGLYDFFGNCSIVLVC